MPAFAWRLVSMNFSRSRKFDSGSVEHAIRNQAQHQREVGYVFAGSQPSLMKEMLSAKRPFHKAGPQIFLDKIPASDWREFITRQFRKRGRTLNEAGIEALLTTADLIPYDVQRIAHELWDYAELKDKRQPDASDVNSVTDTLVGGQSTYYELLWEQLSAAQRGTLQALAERGPADIYSQAIRNEYRLGPPSTVQKALQALDSALKFSYRSPEQNKRNYIGSDLSGSSRGDFRDDKRLVILAGSGTTRMPVAYFSALLSCARRRFRWKASKRLSGQET
jgi:hypothetical protein